MSSVSLYTANNTKHNFLIGSVTPGGSYPPNVQNTWGLAGNAPSGVVNGVTVPSMSEYVNWTYNAHPPVVNNLGTNLKSLESYIGANSSYTFYVLPDGAGTSITFHADAGGDIDRITINSGSYSTTYINQYGSSAYICFVWCDGVGLSQYDNLCIYFRNTTPDGDYAGLHFGGSASCNAYFTNSTSNSIQERFNSGSTLGVNPGEEGFQPIGEITRYTIGGGDVSGDRPGYTTEILTQPGAPDESVASAAGSGFINIYSLNTANLQRLGEVLFDGLISKLNNVFLSPLDSIISLQIFPCTPDVGSSEAIKLLKYTATSADLGADAVGNRLSKQFKVYDFGTLQIPEMWYSFLDYEATSFQLYLPFIGMVDIQISEVMNGSVNVQYTVDFITGMCVANVLCTKNVPLSSGAIVSQYSQHCYMGNCSVQIPLNSVSFANIVGSLAQAASAGLQGGLAAAAGSLAMSAIGGGFKPNVETKGTINSNAGFCAILKPYITITRPISAEPGSFQETEGYPSYIENTLGACKGLCVCDNINLKGLSGATDSEINRIKQMGNEGVYV